MNPTHQDFGSQGIVADNMWNNYALAEAFASKQLSVDEDKPIEYWRYWGDRMALLEVVVDLVDALYTAMGNRHEIAFESSRKDD